MTVMARFQTLVCLSLLAMSGLADERPNIVLIVADVLTRSPTRAFD